MSDPTCLYRFHLRQKDEEWFRTKLIANGQLVPVEPAGTLKIDRGGLWNGPTLSPGEYLIVKVDDYE